MQVHTKPTVQVNVYATKYGATPEQLAAGEGLNNLVFMVGTYEADDYLSKVGTATVEITLMAPAEMVAVKVDSLKAALAKDQADSEVRQNAIRNQISNLLAITHEVSA